MRFRLCANTFWGELNDGRLTDIRQFDVVAVEGLEIAAVNRGSACGKGMAFGCQLVSQHRVIHHRGNFLADEFCSGVVGFFFQQDVEIRQSKTKAQSVPCCLVGLFAFFCRHIQRGSFVGHEPQAGCRIPSAFATLAVTCLDCAVFFIGHRRIGSRNTEVGRALKHRQVLGFFGDDGGHLHAR